MPAIEIIQLSYIKEEVYVRDRVWVCVCLADVLCSLSDSQQYPAADSLFGQADWLTGVCVCLCFLVCEQKGACFAASKSMSPWGNEEPETKSESDWERKKDRERERASPGQTHFALFPLSNLSFFALRLNTFSSKICLKMFCKKKSLKMLNYHSWILTPASSYMLIRVRNLAPLFNLPQCIQGWNRSKHV